MTGTIEIEELATLLREKASGGARVVVAIAGAPGSGKSTVAENLADALNSDGEERAAVLPMDGFHYDDLYLVPAGLRPRKGAPETFDVGGFYHTLSRIRSREDDFVAVPVFDRDIEIARAGARLIPAALPIVIAEGNYLLLDEAPWSRLRPLFDVTVRIDVSEAVLRDRLTARWKGHHLSPDEIVSKLEDNDLPNGRRVISNSASPDFRLING